MSVLFRGWSGGVVLAGDGFEGGHQVVSGNIDRVDDTATAGAGLFRLSRFAGYVKANMPQGASWERPQLTDEEAWDVAAYVNAQPRPTKDLSTDWPDIAKKPVDHPFGPYKDPYSEQQHKFGPFGPIAAFYRLSETKSRSAGKP